MKIVMEIINERNTALPFNLKIEDLPVLVSPKQKEIIFTWSPANPLTKFNMKSSAKSEPSATINNLS